MIVETVALDSMEAQVVLPITQRVQQVIDSHGVRDGICLVFCGHTTAGLTLNSPLDPATAQDLRDELHRLVPTRTDFHHQFDTPADASAHVKSTLVGHSVTVPVIDGTLATGFSQGILFCEFDGPRARQVKVCLLADASP